MTESITGHSVVTIHTRTFKIIIVALVLGALLIWAMSLFIWGGSNYRKGSLDGRQAQSMVNPSQAYIESGQAFCWSEGNWWNVRPVKNGFRVKQ